MSNPRKPMCKNNSGTKMIKNDTLEETKDENWNPKRDFWFRKCQNTYPLGDFGAKSIKNTYPLRDFGVKLVKNTYPVRY